MSLDIQIQTQTLLNLVLSNVQQTLDTTCNPSFPPYFVDHIDASTPSMSLSQQRAEFDVPINVFIVDQVSLAANVNGTPPGAITPAATAVIVLDLTIQGTTLSLACTAVNASNPAFQPVANQMQQAIGTVGTVDLSPIFKELNLPTTTSSDMVALTNSLLIRFNPTTSPADHLQTGENWCLFLDKETAITLVTNQIPLNKLSGHGITGINQTSTWAPNGTTPHVDVKITGAAEVPDPFSGNVELDLHVDFLLQQVIPKDSTQSPEDLEMLVNWSLNIDLGALVPQAIDDYVASLISAQLDPSTFGGTAVGPQEFEISSNLPPLKFGGANLTYHSLVGLQDGMVLGGPVTGIVQPDTDVLSIAVSAFPTTFNHYVDCLTGGPPLPSTLNSVSVTAQCSYSGAAKICEVDIISPPAGGWLNPTSFMSLSPAPGTLTDSGSVSFTFGGTIAMIYAELGHPFEFLLRTTRGVRLISLGLPPLPVVDSDGNVVNSQIVLIRNCPGQPVPWFQKFHIFNPKWSIDPPVDWIDQLEQVGAFESYLITVPGLQQGEIVTFDQPLGGGLSTFTADASGMVVIPALLATRSFDEGATLSRANRGTLANVQIAGVHFERVAVLNTPGALSHQLQGNGQRAVITTTYRERTENVEIDSYGIPRVSNEIRGRDQVVSPSQATASSQQYETSSVHTKIPGTVQIYSVPGHEDSVLSVAELDDGSFCSLTREDDGSIRVTGVLARWAKSPPASGSWAISAAAGNRIAVFAVTPIAIPGQNCGCGKSQ